jgi:hypothetical protein
MATNRPRGFAPWKPQAATWPLLHAIEGVLDTYRSSLPLTGRQVFYRLVVLGAIPKTDHGYKRVLDVLNRSRRGGLVPMGHIRDDGASVAGADRFSSAEDFLQACRHWAEDFDLDLLQAQAHHVEVVCESAGMVPQLARVARPYGVAVRSSGGFDSTTIKHQLGRFYGEIGRPVVVLHVGDHDPSGEHIHQNLADDVGAFSAYYGGSLQLRRIAVTPEQQAAYNLPTADRNPNDARSFASDFTVQAEALPPDVLATIVREAIESELDLDLLAAAQDRQAEIRAELRRRLEQVIDF